MNFDCREATCSARSWRVVDEKGKVCSSMGSGLQNRLEGDWLDPFIVDHRGSPDCHHSASRSWPEIGWGVEEEEAEARLFMDSEGGPSETSAAGSGEASV